MVYLAADHRGFELKEEIKKYLISKEYEVQDLGAFELNPEDDYVDYAGRAAEKIAANPGVNKGIFFCGSGHGVDMVANKFKGVRAALCFNRQVAVQSREHENSNVLVLASDWLRLSDAVNVVGDWLNAEFKGEERHVRRLKKMEEIEDHNFK